MKRLFFLLVLGITSCVYLWSQVIPEPDIGDFLGHPIPVPIDRPIEKIALVDQFKALSPKLPSIAILPIPCTSDLKSSGYGELAQKHLIRALIEEKIYRPVSIQKWLSEAFGKKKLSTIREIAKAAKDQYVEVDFLVTGKIFRSGTKNAVRLAVYPVDQSTLPSYFLRYFEYENELEERIRQIVAELKVRPPQVSKKVPRLKKIAINPMEINFFLYSQLKTGAFTFSPAPFLFRDGVDYQPGDDYVSDLVGYSLHASRLVDLMLPDGLDWVQKGNVARAGADYIVAMSLSMTDKLSLIDINVLEVATNSSVLSLKVPIKELTMDYLAGISRYLAKQIILAISSPKERMALGEAACAQPAELALDMFVASYYMGTSFDQQILPVGLNVVSMLPKTIETKDILKNVKAKTVSHGPIGILVQAFGDPLYLSNIDSLHFTELERLGRIKE